MTIMGLNSKETVESQTNSGSLSIDAYLDDGALGESGGWGSRAGRGNLEPHRGKSNRQFGCTAVK
ncbi:hypothetical protein Micbo1qcDRAFT_166622, partial [Microdochium bolleyi]